ncbi:Phosphodiesterase/alkaline phosphatase D [Sandaracinus amylolyticus]|uniref:Phosphodiesterase/alkaline phosphatase D n=2 Tax=Sandaracinus amylolyticus TaxID=927083 RepID=A0A0F6YFV6_9BACT|nr:Phosphodiesterase/alkaline phosphatase D [Sandaracinus amylolyticus]
MSEPSDRDDERSETKQTRREFLGAAVVAAVGLGTGCGGGSTGADPDGGALARDARIQDDDASTEIDAGPPDSGVAPVDPPDDVTEAALAIFPLGVASGDATTTRAIVWTRYTGDRALELVVWEMDEGRYARTVHAAEVAPGEHGVVRVDVEALTPGARHRYVFFEIEAGERVARSPIGRLRAAPDGDVADVLRIGACSCTSNSREVATLAHAASREDLDVFLYLGDTTYNDGARSLAQYRDKWDESLSRAGYRAIRGATSGLSTWDDHEFDNDWNPETFDAAQLVAAKQTFFEHQPVRRDESAPDRVWKSMRWGRTAEIFVLDCRSERKPSTRRDENAEYLSRAQMDWLKAGLAASDAVFKILVNSVPIANFPTLFDAASNDRWEGYAAQRDEILGFIDDEAIPGVLWVAGDFHLASAQRVSPSGPGSAQVEILAGPGAQTGNPLAGILGGDQFDFQSTTNNYVVIDLDPATTRARVWWYDASGSAIETIEYPLG